VYDQFFAKGKKVLFQVALAIFEILEPQILKIDEGLEVVDFVKAETSSLSCETLMEVQALYQHQPLVVGYLLARSNWTCFHFSTFTMVTMVVSPTSRSSSKVKRRSPTLSTL